MSRTTSTSTPGRCSTGSIRGNSRSRSTMPRPIWRRPALIVDAMKQDYKHMLSDAAAQQAQVDLDQTNYDRAAHAAAKAAPFPRPCYDQAQYTLQNDKSKLESLQPAGASAARQARRQCRHPDRRSIRNICRRKRRSTKRNASSTTPSSRRRSPAPSTSVPSIAPGKYLAASTTAFYLVDTDHVWVDANPKETELTYVRPGQPVTVTVDTYPDVVWHGTVESISPAAAQEFSLLPAQNTSGNWVKVVQRVPMRVRVDTSDKNKPPLRAGMSVEVNVDTGHARGFPHFLVMSAWLRTPRPSTQREAAIAARSPSA